MATLSGKPRADYVRSLFVRIASHYDRANRWMTWGQDVKWRREVLKRASLPVEGRLLDVGTGTGDLALSAIRRDRSACVTGMDFSFAMIQEGRNKEDGELVRWLLTDAMNVPFDSGIFDAVVSGYLLRNVIDIEKVLTEEFRVLKQGGHIACLDTTPIPEDIWHLPALIYVKHIIPLIGAWIAGDRGAYRYLPESTQSFLTADVLANLMMRIGFKNVCYRRFMLGAMAIHWGEK